MRKAEKAGQCQGPWQSLRKAGVAGKPCCHGSFGIVGAFRLLLTRTIEDHKSQKDKLQRCFTLCLQEQPKMPTTLVCLCLSLLSTALATPVSMAFPGFPARCWKCEVVHQCIPACFQQGANMGCSCVHHLWCLGQGLGEQQR